MKNLESLRNNLTENGFDVLSSDAAYLLKGGTGYKRKNSGKSSGKSSGKKGHNGNKGKRWAWSASRKCWCWC